MAKTKAKGTSRNPQAAAPAAPQPAAPAQQGKGGSALTKVLGLVAVLVIVGILYMVFFNGRGSHGYGGVNSGTPPTVLTKALASKNGNFANVSGALLQQLSTASMFNISYGGSAQVSSPALPLGLSITVPINISYEKYQNAHRLAFTSAPPLIGKGGLVAILTGGPIGYICIEANTTALSALLGSNVTASPGNPNQYQCTVLHTAVASGSPGTNQSLNASMIAEQLSSGGATSGVEFRELYHASYNGMGCTMVEANGTVSSGPVSGPVSNPAQPGPGGSSEKYNVTACLYDQYLVPLNVTARINISTGRLSATSYIHLDELSIGQPTTLSEVTALPGPIVNSTINGAGP